MSVAMFLPVKLYLQKQSASLIWLIAIVSLTPGLECRCWAERMARKLTRKLVCGPYYKRP